MTTQQMEEISVDFSGVKPFEPLDPGVVYLARISEFKPGQSKEKNPKMSMEATIEGPEEVSAMDQETGKSPSGHMTKASGRKLFREYSLDTKALPFLHELIKAVKPDAELGENFRLKPAEYIGELIAVKIENEVYEEQVRSRIKRILPAKAYKPVEETAEATA